MGQADEVFPELRDEGELGGKKRGLWPVVMLDSDLSSDFCHPLLSSVLLVY